MRRRLIPLILIVTLAAAGVITAVVTDSSPNLGLDLQGGISVVLAPAEDEESDNMGERLDQAVEIIRQRVDGLGVAEPEISRRGDNIVVDLPGVDDRERVLELLGSTAELRFRPVLEQVPSEVFHGDEEAEDADGVEAPEEQQELTPPEADEPTEQVILEDKDGTTVYTLGPMLATGQIVEGAQASLDEVGQWYVGLTFRSGEEGIDQFNQAAQLCFSGGAECPTTQLAIVLDSEVQSAPQINEPTYDRSGATISGEFGEREAKDLALVLRYGALPVELERQSVETVSASVGEDSLRAGIVAGMIGFALVGMYMILYYRALGVVVLLGMGLWAALMYVVVAWLGTTQGLALTLAGVTAIIVSVGVTVDSYIVGFERLKDEVKLGRTLRTSADRAFKRAFRTIVAANTSTLIGAVVLWWLTVGAVRGFAFYLGLSSILDLLVTFTFTRSAVGLMSRSRLFSETRGIGIKSALPSVPSAAKAEAGATS